MARLTALASGQISKADAEIARQDLILQRAQANYDARVANTEANRAEVQARLQNLNDLINVADGILKAEIG